MNKYYLLSKNNFVINVIWDNMEENIEELKSHFKCDVVEIIKEEYKAILDDIFQK